MATASGSREPEQPSTPARLGISQDPLPRGSFGANTPSKRKSTSKVWEYVKRLKTNTADAKALLLDGYTHVCVYPIGDDKVCNHLLKVTKPNGMWSTVAPGRHMITHTESVAAQEKTRRSNRSADEKVGMSLLAGGVKEPPVLPPVFALFKMTPKQYQLTMQAQWYVYSEQQISKRTFEDPYFVKLMHATAGTAGAPVLKQKQLKKYVRAEFEVFVLFVRHLLWEKMDQALGNSGWGQLIHDGGTLENHRKYQAFGLQVIDPKWRCNHVLCFGLPHSPSGTDAAIATSMEESFDAILGSDVIAARFSQLRTLSTADVFGSAIADRAAKGVAAKISLEEEVCGMHDGDKLGQSAVGALVRTKARSPVNPFPEGQRVMKAAHKMGTHFTYGTRYEKLWRIGDASAPGKSPHTRIQVDLNGTRVAAQYNLLHSELRLHHALPLYRATLTGREASAEIWDASPEMLTAMAELEAVLNITKVTTTLCQYEHLYTGAFKSLIQGTTMRALRKGSIEVIDLASTDAGPRLPRREVRVSDLSPVGQTARERATLEGERRYCGNNSETLEHNPIIMSDRQKLATLLDLRTVGAAHLTREQATEALDLLESKYVDFAMRAMEFKRAKEAREEQAERSAAMSEVKLVESHNETSLAAQGKFNLDSGVTYGESRWSDDPDDDLEEARDSEFATDVAMREKYLAEARTCFKSWRRVKVDWMKQFPEEKLVPPLDAVNDLIQLDIGRVYSRLEVQDANRKLYGFLPLMASCSIGQLGALNAESFCERVLRCAGHVLTEGNTLLSDEELEMLVILRMNRKFMEFMRGHYPGLAKSLAHQHFGHTTVDPVGDEESSGSR